MDALCKKSQLLTGYFEYLLNTVIGAVYVKILTPTNPVERGCQLSLFVNGDVDKLNHLMERDGIVCDIRRPNVIRCAPVPLYNTFSDVHYFVNMLQKNLRVVGVMP
jgi:kynureninase